MSKWTRAGKAAQHEAPGILGTLQGAPAVAMTRAVAIHYAQRWSDKQVGLVAAHPAETVTGEIAAIEGEIAVLRFPGGRTARHPLQEVFDPTVCLAHIRNLGPIGASLLFDPDRDEPRLDALPGRSLLDGPPPDFSPELSPAARVLLIRGWHGLRDHKAEQKPGWPAVLFKTPDGIGGAFAPASAIRELAIDLKAPADFVDSIGPTPPGMMRVYLISPGAMTWVDLLLGQAHTHGVQK